MKHIVLTIIGTFLFLTSCDSFRSEEARKLASMNEKLIEINNTFKNKEFMGKAEILENRKNDVHSIIVYYDANCSVCFSDLKLWKELIKYFEEIEKDIHFKFILSSGDKNLTDINLKDIDFPKSNVVYDTNHEFLKTYRFADNKAYNTLLLDKDNKVVFIGSPLVSDNLKKHYKNIISKK